MMTPVSNVLENVSIRLVNKPWVDRHPSTDARAAIASQQPSFRRVYFRPGGSPGHVYTGGGCFTCDISTQPRSEKEVRS